MRRLLSCFAVMMALLMTSITSAHQPTYSNGEYGTSDSAWPITDIDLSIVLYHQVTCDAAHLWLAFNALEPTDIFVQLGVPTIPRLEDYRPSIAILAPGLPPLEEPVPFEVPEGLGGVIFHTADVTEPEAFFEPFTQTESWILKEVTYPLPQAGYGYIVAWHPERETGKAWVAVGDVEDFSDVDWVEAEKWFENTQTFHETGDYTPEVVPEEEICPEPERPEPERTEPEPETPNPPEAGVLPEEAGCSGGETPPSGLGLLIVLGFIAGLRRRRRARA